MDTTVTVRLVLDHSPSYPTRHIVDEQFTHTDPVVALARAYRRARALMGGRGPEVPHWLIWEQPYGWALETMDDCQYSVDVILAGRFNEWDRRDRRLTQLREAPNTPPREHRPPWRCRIRWRATPAAPPLWRAAFVR